MKNFENNKENNYLLNHKENYKKELNESINIVTKKYAELLTEYIKFIIENTNIKKEDYFRFIIIRGLNTITHVFNNILYYTKNIDLTYYHCLKSFYFYIEFISQINEDEKMFLKLTTRDATIYVYKKTIFEINDELKKQNDLSNFCKKKIDIINIYINLYQIYLLKIIQLENIKDNNSMNKLVNIFIELFDKLSNSGNKTEMNILFKINEELFYKITNVTLFFDINKIIVDKFIENPNSIKICEKNIDEKDFEEKNLDSNDKIIEWLYLF